MRDMRRAVFVTVVLLEGACGLSSQGLGGEGGDAMPSHDLAVDAGAGDGQSTPFDSSDHGGDGTLADDGCNECSGKDAVAESDRGVDALPDGVPGDAPGGEDGPAPVDAGARGDVASCVTGAVTCPLLALPCCTVVASSSYGTCAPPAICR